MEKITASQRLFKAVVAVALVIYLLLRYILGIAQYPFLLDDAYITLRYAQNLADHGKLIYDSGPSIFGITTILFPVILAGLLKVFSAVSSVIVVMVFNMLLEGLCIIFGTIFLSRIGIYQYVALLISFAWVSNFFFLSASQGGMETPLFCLCILLMLLTVKEYPFLAAFWASLALFVRPEGCLLIGIMLLLNLFIFKRKNVYCILVIAAVAYFSFFYLFYGTLVPQSVLIKRELYAPAWMALQAILTNISSLIPIAKIPLWLRLGAIYLLIAYGVYRWPQKDAAFFILFGFPSSMLILYTVQNPPMWFWYVIPYIFCLAPFFFYGVVKLFESLKVHQGVLCGVLLFLITLHFKSAFISEKNLLTLYTERVSGYYDVVQKIQKTENLSAGDSLLTHEIGAIGFYSKAHICDAVGLVTPKLAALGVVEEEKGKYVQYGYATEKLVRACDPDYILFQRDYFDPKLLASDFFKEKYQFLFTQPHTSINASSGDLMIFKKRHQKS